MRRFASLVSPLPHPVTRLSRRWFALLLLALVATLLNAAKPLHIDDYGFHQHAAQIARDPLSPYGFEIIWEHLPRPAVEILGAPVWPYWWALGIRLFGDHPVLWKLWLLPINLLLVWSLHALLHRFVRRFELPLLGMTVLSPALLPGLNLMTDIPALALSLCAVAGFLRAVDRQSRTLATVAGLAAGLAMQTKYTGLVTPAVLLLHAILYRRLRLGLLACAAAGLVFVAWEGLIAVCVGASPFLGQCIWFSALNPSFGAKIGHLLQALPTLLGGLAPAVMLLGLTALGCSRRVVLGAGAGVGVGYLLLGIVPDSAAVLLRSPHTGKPWLTLPWAVCGTLGIATCVTLAAVVRRLWQGPRPEGWPWLGPRWPARRAEWFLLLWLGLELAGYFVLSPFPAARRILAIVVVCTLLAGRLAARTCRGPEQRALLHWVALGGVGLGLGFCGVDWRDAWAQKEAAERAAVQARGRPPGATAWFLGTWGFEFYARRAGLRPLVLGRSRLHRGDRLVVYDNYFLLQDRLRQLDGAPLEVVDRVRVADALPLRAAIDYYSGAISLRHHHGTRASATVYRVAADFVPALPR
jgi:hypothetical protein